MSRRRRIPAYPTDLPCVVLAVDPGSTCGWALLEEGVPIQWGSERKTDQRTAERIVRLAGNYASEAALPLVVVGESWGAGGNRGMAQWQGLGAAWGVWRMGIARIAAEHPAVVKSRVVRVTQSTWRARFGMNSRMGSTALKAAAVRLAASRAGVQLAPEEHDIAEALLIGLWGARAGEVGKKLPKTIMRKRGLLREASRA